jgi:hypothetical protein
MEQTAKLRFSHGCRIGQVMQIERLMILKSIMEKL